MELKGGYWYSALSDRTLRIPYLKNVFFVTCSSKTPRHTTSDEHMSGPSEPTARVRHKAQIVILPVVLINRTKCGIIETWNTTKKLGR
jgi:hypothetical protein